MSAKARRTMIASPRGEGVLLATETDLHIMAESGILNGTTLREDKGTFWRAVRIIAAGERARAAILRAMLRGGPHPMRGRP